MTNYKLPGVYASIRDLSGVVAVNATTACAYVGEAEYGPINTPVLLTSLQDYVNKFGAVSSKYGYGGYSLAVAADTIGEHHYVRVVPTGDAEMDEADRKYNAKYGYATLMTATSTEIAPTHTRGYFYEEVMAAVSSTEAYNDSGLFDRDDTNQAFKVVATDPNNRALYVSIEDTTINENRAFEPLNVTAVINPTDPTKTNVTVEMDALFIAEIEELVTNMVISKLSINALNGIFKVIEVDDIANTFTYTADYAVTEGELIGFSGARVGLYPEDTETSFSVTVAEKIGKVMQILETYQFCTLYAAVDNYGNSTFVEDVINGYSDYIQVFANPNEEKSVVPADAYDIALTGGFAGEWKDKDGASQANLKTVDLNKAWDLFSDRSQTNVSLLMNSGYVNTGDVSYQAKMLEIAEHRRDCFCLFDAPMTDTEYENLIDWRRNTQAFNSYRGAVSSPWIKSYDSLNGKANFIMCPSAYVAKIMGSSQPWIAPAGLNRGILAASSTMPTGLTQYYNDIQAGNLYTDNQINCILKNQGAGYVNWGQRTLQAKPSALDRINVARTVIYIETVLRDAAKWHVFENNTAYTRMKITLEFSSFLNTILSAEGIQRFEVICDDTNNTPIVIANNQLAIDIKLWPTYCAEVITIRSTIMGADTTVDVTTG